MSFQTRNEVLDYIRKVFGKDVEILDATFPLRIQPTPEDANGADPKDPTNCFFVHTVRRMYGSQAVVFWRDVAYTDLVDTDGIRRVFRFMNPKAAVNRIARFDNGEAFPLGSGITLLQPVKSHTLKAMRKSAAKRTKRYADRRKQLQNTLEKKKRSATLAAQRLTNAMVNEKQDAKKIAQIKKQKAVAEESLKKARVSLAEMDKNKQKRAPKKFDLTTRNGAIGNYKFSGLKSAA
jgi:flagellar biosynthesis GTPase FlhF